MESWKILRKDLIETQMPWWFSGIELDLWQIYAIVEEIYPTLCDFNLIRTEDGSTIRWKHYTRLALEELKKKGILAKVNPSTNDGRWVKI